MAQRKKSKAEGSKTSERFSGGFGDYQFVRHTMSRDEMDSFHAWDVVDADIWLETERLIDSDYKLSINRDDYNRCVTASLTCRNASSENVGLILTARAAAPYDALRMLIFKHAVVLGGDWTAFRPGAGGQENYG